MGPSNRGSRFRIDGLCFASEAGFCQDPRPSVRRLSGFVVVRAQCPHNNTHAQKRGAQSLHVCGVRRENQAAATGDARRYQVRIDHIVRSGRRGVEHRTHEPSDLEGGIDDTNRAALLPGRVVPGEQRFYGSSSSLTTTDFGADHCRDENGPILLPSTLEDRTGQGRGSRGWREGQIRERGAVEDDGSAAHATREMATPSSSANAASAAS